MLAAGIAAVATAIALAWHDQLLAGLGLVGAILAPLAVAVRDDELATAGVAFARADARGRARRVALPRLVSAARRRDRRRRRPGRGAAARRLRARGRGARARDRRSGRSCSRPASSRRCGAGVTRLAGSYVVLASAFSGYAAAALYDDRALGVALLASALANGVLAAILFRRERDLASLLWAAGARARRRRDGAARLGRDADDRLGGRGGRARLAGRARARAALPPRRARLARARARPRARRRRAGVRAVPRERASRLRRAEPARPGRRGRVDGVAARRASSASPARAGPRSRST